MNKSDNERKPGFRSPGTILQIIVIAGIIAGWGMTYATLKGDIKHLKEDVVELKESHGAFKEFNDKLGEIAVRLTAIETTLSMEKK